MKKILIAYYSFSDTTRDVARSICSLVSGNLMEIVPKKPYAFDYTTAAKEARAEIACGFCPELASGGAPIDVYDIVFIGTPNWFKSLAPPVLSFLRQHDFSNKTVIPFCTHGGGGFGEIEQRIAEECAGATMLPGLAGSGIVENSQLVEWLQRIRVVSDRAGNMG